MALSRVLPTPAMPNTVTARRGAFTNSSALLNSMECLNSWPLHLMQRPCLHKRAANSAGGSDSIAGMLPHSIASPPKNSMNSTSNPVGIMLALILANASDGAKGFYGVSHGHLWRSFQCGDRSAGPGACAGEHFG